MSKVTGPDAPFKATADLRRRLVRCASESIRYVALGSVLRRDILAEYEITEQHLDAALRAISTALCEKIERL